MKRLGVFHFYEKNGVVNDYIETLLGSFQSVLSKLIIIVNGKLSDSEFQKLQVYSDIIYQRENIGFDAGAYKDFFLDLHQETWDLWDEIIIFNSTFYGPFYEWTDIFKRMEEEKVDFWGLSRHHGGVRLCKGRDLVPEHIQAYFLAIRKNMFQSIHFLKFWEDLKYPRDYYEAVENFECRFTQWFKKKGFKYTSWIDIHGINPYIAEGIDPCTEYIYELLTEYKFPIIKYKTMSIGNFTQMKKALQYLQENTNYDTNLIIDHIKIQSREKRWRPFSIETLEEFKKNHNKIYIFGNGKYGKELDAYFSYKNWEIEAHVVSKPIELDEIAFGDFMMDPHDGIIVALGKVALAEMQEKLSGKFEKNQILFPFLG